MRESLTRRAVLPAAAAACLLSLPAREFAAAADIPPPRPFLVTGASSGIGRAATLLLSAEERFVLCAARTAEAAQGVATAQGSGASLNGYGLALTAGLEQSDLSSVRAYVERLYQELPQVELCVWVVRDPASRNRVACESCSAWYPIYSPLLLAAGRRGRAAVRRRRGAATAPHAAGLGGGL